MLWVAEIRDGIGEGAPGEVLDHVLGHDQRGVALDEGAGGVGAVIVVLDLQGEIEQAEVLVLKGVGELVGEDHAVLGVLQAGVRNMKSLC